ncbi:UNKNOWN [Stylonychia lemnae]|uniref:Uncharacterized protein n=1 Tax=Stylonychia lemnae TaxID=5949 RepID=A0A078BES8_STYLE|nr:UNKNOWN [Stylonychia lemnae]|eukprot:CDW91667.1 UNKNOWN [Stylonychia lemnae]
MTDVVTIIGFSDDQDSGGDNFVQLAFENSDQNITKFFLEFGFKSNDTHKIALGQVDISNLNISLIDDEYNLFNISITIDSDNEDYFSVVIQNSYFNIGQRFQDNINQDQIKLLNLLKNFPLEFQMHFASWKMEQSIDINSDDTQSTSQDNQSSLQSIQDWNTQSSIRNLKYIERSQLNSMSVDSDSILDVNIFQSLSTIYTPLWAQNSKRTCNFQEWNIIMEKLSLKQQCSKFNYFYQK